MRLLHVIRLLTVLPLLLGLIMAVLLVFAARQDYLKLQQLGEAQAITFESINLMGLGRDVVRYPGERRAPRQWKIVEQRMTELLSRIHEAGYQERVERMRREQRMLDDLFQRISLSGVSDSTALSQGLLHRLESQMAVHAQTLAAEAGNLMRDIQREQADFRQRIDSLIVGLLLILTFMVTVFTGLTGRRLLHRLQRMREATTQIGTGNLNYRIGDTHRDELGAFSRAFDTMTSNLRQVTASLDDLQREIDARVQAQLELQDYKNHLEELVAIRTGELVQSNRQLRETQFAMDRSGIAIQWLDADSGRLLYVNDQTGTMLGYSLDELLRLGIGDICPDFPRERFIQLAISCREQGYIRLETSYQTKCGRFFPVEAVLYYQPPQPEIADRFIVFATDISQRKAAEQALLQAKEAAEASNRAKSVFLSNMSHELRTPLNAILGFAQIMARDDSLDKTHRDRLETINRSGRHLLSLINDVLEISRIEAGRTTVQNEVFCLPDTLMAVEDMIRARAELKSLRFVSEYLSELPRYVVGDAHHLRQVLINLLGNAIKYTERGEVRLRLQVTEGGIRFEVADTGIGIAAADIPHIFQAFYQTDAGVAKGEGTGLGLAISHEFIRLMGSEINVSSELGKGSVFGFTLSLPEADAPATSVEPSRVIGLAMGQPTVRVLVVEDNADSRELITLLLNNVGFDVRAVENGQQAIDCFQSWQPQFIWMDMRMPVLDGYRATKVIRSLPGGGQVKIVALTANAFREDRQAILEAGCDEMLSKPVDEYRLFQIMGDLLGLHYRFDDACAAPLAGQTAFDTALDLSPLGPALRNELAEAAELLDADVVQAIIERLRPDYPEQAKAIATWIDAYRFDVVAKVCRGKAD